MNATVTNGAMDDDAKSQIYRNIFVYFFGQFEFFVRIQQTVLTDRDSAAALSM